MENLVLAPERVGHPSLSAGPGVPADFFGGVYAGRRVLVTGHTGFKGAWLCEWLLGLGAEVTGFSLPPPTRPALFDQLDLGKRMRHLIVDLCDAAAVRRVVKRVQPDFVFHLAAQPLVRDSYAAPVATYAINVLGTAHLLDAVRTIARPCAVICVTTDKCYENRETLRGYREDDPLGGHDPYSSSKAAAEIAIAAWRRSFFSGHPVKIASARAGNAIGGGDWARDRIVPDCVRSLRRGEVIQVRNPASVRPWQHVLEPLSGYLWLAAALSHPVLTGQPLERLCSAFNFGPTAEANQSVGELVNEMLRHWRGRWEDTGDARRLHEAKLLRLTTDKARLLLGWTPAWGFREAIAGTVEWYRTAAQRPSGSVLRELTAEQIGQYCAAARRAGISWADEI